mmetsp:Transcript_4743/g.7752  ORF Transcript_4743/g.7752 Transcript_4743/m.7752 type:complete len:98 (-) Transcript_4743:536-829(-)
MVVQMQEALGIVAAVAVIAAAAVAVEVKMAVIEVKMAGCHYKCTAADIAADIAAAAAAAPAAAPAAAVVGTTILVVTACTFRMRTHIPTLQRKISTF